MQFTLQRLGALEVDIDPATVIRFPQGIPPFDDCKQYKLFHEEGKASVFWLQSLDDPALLFSLTDPGLLSLTYEVRLSDTESAVLEAAPDNELALAVLLYKQEDTATPSVRANMRAPIILNLSKRIGLQKTLQGFETAVAIRGY